MSHQCDLLLLRHQVTILHGSDKIVGDVLTREARDLIMEKLEAKNVKVIFSESSLVWCLPLKIVYVSAFRVWNNFYKYELLRFLLFFFSFFFRFSFFPFPVETDIFHAVFIFRWESLVNRFAAQRKSKRGNHRDDEQRAEAGSRHRHTLLRINR